MDYRMCLLFIEAVFVINDVQAAFRCDFENFCSMTQVQFDDFDWTLNTGPTPTSSTGPNSDRFNHLGRYAYIEVSAPTKAGDEALLVTPAISVCHKHELSFFYHMFGQDIGSLSVLTYKYFPSSLASGNVIWKRTGPVGNIWKNISLTIEVGTKYVGFLASKSDVSDFSVDGDIAIDGIIIDSSFTCEFKDFCGMATFKGDDIFWTTHSAGTPLWQTDQTSDRLNSGTYAYINVHNPTKTVDQALLVAPAISVCMEHELSFVYYLFGRNRGSLSVVTYTTFPSSAKSSGIEIWKQIGSEDNVWKRVRLTIEQGTTYIGFLASRPNDFLGVIAIDWITIDPTNILCPGANWLNDVIPEEFLCDNYNDCGDGWDESVKFCR